MKRVFIISTYVLFIWLQYNDAFSQPVAYTHFETTAWISSTFDTSSMSGEQAKALLKKSLGITWPELSSYLNVLHSWRTHTHTIQDYLFLWGLVDKWHRFSIYNVDVEGFDVLRWARPKGIAVAARMEGAGYLSLGITLLDLLSRLLQVILWVSFESWLESMSNWMQLKQFLNYDGSCVFNLQVATRGRAWIGYVSDVTSGH